MKVLIKAALGLALVTAMTSASTGQEQLIDDFSASPERSWAYFADTVMGGVSAGGVEFKQDANRDFARMTGTVSTANNGGFIQIRRYVSAPTSDAPNGIRLKVRGNNQRYYVHLRTSGTRLPWQYYQGEFDVDEGWRDIRIPFSEFKAAGGLLLKNLNPSSLTTIGIVAYGRDHEAEIEVSEVGYY
jgi:hypothetical protein